MKDEQTIQEKSQLLQARLEEIEVENKYMNDDIDYLSNALKRNIEEASNILKEFALINGLAKDEEEESIMEFTNEWPDQFEEGTVYPKDTTQDKWDEIADKTLSASLTLLEEAVNKLKDDFNNDKPKDK